MKKSLLALAVLGVFAAGASAQVTLKGTVDVAIERVKTDTTSGSSTDYTLSNNRQGTSQLTALGSEDLGGGLSAIFLYEGDFDATVSSTSGSGHRVGDNGGEVYVGLKGAFGTLRMGSPNTPTLSTQGGRQPFGTKLGGGFGGVEGKSHVRQDKSIRYDSPALGPVSLAFDVANDPDGNGRIYDLGAFVNAGPFSGGLTYFKQESYQKLMTLQAQVKFGMATIYGGYHKESGDIGKNKGYNLGAKLGFGSLNLLANYGKLTDDVGSADKKIFAFGPQYLLSKRSSVYARLVQEKFDNASTEKKTTILMGMQHNF